MKKAVLMMVTILGAMPVFAEEAAHAASSSGSLTPLAAGLAIGLAAFGGALAQGKVGGAAMDGIARNPQARQDMFVPMIIGLALIESLVIYALLISFQLVGKI